MKFKPGDAIVIIANEWNSKFYTIGDKGKIISCCSYYCDVDFNNGKRWLVLNTDMAMAEDNYGIKKTILPKETPKECEHPNKYINRSTSKPFWVCPDCKADLGDA